jgi:hypothetical protein
MAALGAALRTTSLPGMLKEAGITALVATALLIPVVGFKIVNRGGDQFLDTRWRKWRSPLF